MSPQDLKVGSAYYQITYADRELTIPGVDAMIYVGVNVFDSDSSAPTPMYTFQDTVSFSRFGLFTEYEGPADLSEEGLFTQSFTPEELVELTDLQGAAAALNAAVERARAKGQ